MNNDGLTFYVLLLIDKNGAERLEAAYRKRELAERKGKEIGQRFKVCVARL
jgi:hypothetical protein